CARAYDVDQNGLRSIGIDGALTAVACAVDSQVLVAKLAYVGWSCHVAGIDDLDAIRPTQISGIAVDGDAICRPIRKAQMTNQLKINRGRRSRTGYRNLSRSADISPYREHERIIARRERRH